jgi:hypothetical protein
MFYAGLAARREFEVITAVVMKIQRCVVHGKRTEDHFALLVACFTVTSRLAYSSILNMEATFLRNVDCMALYPRR